MAQAPAAAHELDLADRRVMVDDRRQVVAEAFLVAAIGGVLGLAIAPLLTRILLTLYPGELPRAAEIHISLRTLGGALVGIVGA